MKITRPDLSQVSPAVLAYIQRLEERIARLEGEPPAPSPEEPAAKPDLFEPNEPPTPIQLITLSKNGVIKRTPRHLYARQRRGGMGVFDLDIPESDAPALLALADVEQTLILFSDQGRCYRLPVNKLAEAPVRARGSALLDHVPLRHNERIIAALPEGGGAHIALAGERGWVSLVRASFVGSTLIPGVAHHDAEKRGPLAAACWVGASDADLFLATRQGQGVRFAVRQIAASGCLGIRLERDDTLVAVTAVTEESSVFLLGDDGKGTLRQMSTFHANKMPGAGGKGIIKTERLVGAATVGPQDDLFVISRHSKIIRFAANEVPPKESIVQGVNCMLLRGDETLALTVMRAPEPPVDAAEDEA